jgi:hypothetical protein
MQDAFGEKYLEAVSKIFWELSIANGNQFAIAETRDPDTFVEDFSLVEDITCRVNGNVANYVIQKLKVNEVA